ncbi:heptaprenyl diphosphate synthase [Psychrobacillus sp. OK028]|uniref:heptaprenyl diphosphate synthase component 1 n=1 Tax=Psychrobacillus sp. OK028 TaxID=1884359 RepID=UPI000889F315|nr:heptaprenyl diphosphate synthase component 1 [Psychrobacillus sp. OK028]SDN01160.1 heptaprenyl diphosphate synthase [Psychrobacillus sp. OK028]
MNEALIKQHIKQYKDGILKQVQQKTLLKYTGAPVIDEERLFFTLLPLLNGEEWEDSQSKSAIAVTLIFSALAAHDLVKESSATTKAQQLQVLAGDYYSGKYYQLLASDKQLDLIQQLSEGIAAISENKTRFYDRQLYSFDELIQSIQLIESKSIEQFLEYYSYHDYVFFMKESLLLITLKKELAAYEQGEQPFYISKSSQLQANLNLLQTEIKKVESLLINEIKNSELLQDQLKSIILSKLKICTLEKQLREG